MSMSGRFGLAEVGDARGLDAGLEGVVVPACCAFSAA